MCEVYNKIFKIYQKSHFGYVAITCVQSRAIKIQFYEEK